MKSLPVVVNIALFAGVCATATYWGMQIMKPAARPVAAPVIEQAPPLNQDAAAELFGGHPAPAAVASSYTLKGVVFAQGGVSQAIIATDGRPPQAVALGGEIAPGVTLKEVAAHFVVISEGGVDKRLELPDPAHGAAAANVGGFAPPPPAGVPVPPAQTYAPPQPPPQPQLPPAAVAGQPPMNMPLIGSPPQQQAPINNGMQ